MPVAWSSLSWLHEHMLSLNRLPIQSLFLVFVAGLILFIYRPIIQSDALIMYDDNHLIPPIEQLHSFQDYLDAYDSGDIIDRQYVRDASFFLDAAVSRIVGFKTYHLTNVLLWLIFIYGVFLILQQFRVRWGLIYFFTLYFAVHPITTNSVAWSSSRKHLLSGLFTCWLTYLWIRFRNEKYSHWLWVCPLLYGLAIFSQPINIAWPAWAAAYAFLWSTKPRGSRGNFSFHTQRIVILGFCAGFAVLAAYVNLEYYASEAFRKFAQVDNKYVPEGWPAVVDRLRVYGRYVFQLTFPFRPSINPYYKKEVWMALTGWLLVPMWWTLFRRAQLGRHSLWFLFMSLPVLVTTVKLIIQRGWDTYILTSLVGWVVLLALLSEYVLSHQALRSWMVKGAAALVLAGFMIVTTEQAASWVDEDKLDHRALVVERSPYTKMVYGRKLVNRRQNWPMLWTLIKEVDEEEPNELNLPYVLSATIARDPGLTSEQRQTLFSKNARKDPWYLYNWAAYMASTGDLMGACTKMNETRQLDPKQVAFVLADSIAEVSFRWCKMCCLAGDPTCRQIAPDLKRVASPTNWHESVFNEPEAASCLDAH